MPSSKLFYDMSDKLVKVGFISSDYDITTSRVNFFTRYACSNFETGNYNMQSVL